MDNWLILTKFSVIIYMIAKYISGDMAYPAYFVFSLLIYISINMIFYLTRSVKIKRLISLASLVLLMFCYMNVSRLLILLVPLNIYELYLGSAGLIFTLSITFIVSKSVAPEYMSTALMSYLIYYIVNNLSATIENLKSQNDDLRSKVYELYKRIDTGREYEKQARYTAQLEERNSISQRIHDDVGHTISGSLMQLEAAKVLIDCDKDGALKMIQNSIRSLRDGLESIRAVLKDIKPPQEQMGINRLKLMTDDFRATSGIDTYLKISGDIDKISYMYWNIIIEDTRELLTNAVKYAKASRIDIGIDVLNLYIKAEVRDNGAGASSIKKGLGLKGIEERVGNTGGKVIIDGSDGFSVITLLPVGGITDGDKGIDSR